MKYSEAEKYVRKFVESVGVHLDDVVEIKIVPGKIVITTLEERREDKTILGQKTISRVEEKYPNGFITLGREITKQVLGSK